jgi:hypothetical protein
MKTPQIAGLAAAGAVAAVVIVGIILLLSNGGDDDDSTDSVGNPSPTATRAVAEATADPSVESDEIEVDEPEPAPPVTSTLSLGESEGDTATVYIALSRQGTDGRTTNTHGRLIGVTGSDAVSLEELQGGAPADVDVECLVDFTQSAGTLVAPCVAEVPKGSTLTIAPGPEFTYTVRDTFAAGSIEFGGWTGCDAEDDGRCVVKVEEDIALVANFRPLAYLEIEKRGYPGDIYGTPSSLPSGTRCAGNPSTTEEDDLDYPISGCVWRFPSGTRVTLTAKEGLGTLDTFLHPGDPGFPEALLPPGDIPRFLRFVGDCEDGTADNVCEIELNGGRTYEVLALYEFYECPEGSPAHYPLSQHPQACGEGEADGPKTPSEASGGPERRQRICDEPPPAPAGFQVPPHLTATVAILSAISDELGQRAVDYAAFYDPEINPRVEWFLNPALELHTRAKPGQSCGDPTPTPR